MADAGAGSSAAGGGSNEKDNSYFGSLVDQFAARYGAWKKENNWPQTSEGYKKNLGKSQTSTCARIAALHYQTEKGVDLDEVSGIDSHMFECKWVDPNDSRLCFHVTFSAWLDQEEDDEEEEEEEQDNRTRFKRVFFAELVGTNNDGPQIVTSCVMFRDGMRDFSVKNCKFCTGLRHPVGGGFRGNM